MILAELENHKGMPIIGDKNGSTNFTEEKMKFAFLMVEILIVKLTEQPHIMPKPKLRGGQYRRSMYGC